MLHHDISLDNDTCLDPPKVKILSLQMAERGDFFSKLKGLCQQLDKQIPQLNSQLKERKTTDKDRYDRTVLLKDLNVAVDKMNVSCELL